MAALEPVNAVADAAPGFLWRLQTEDGDATAIHSFEWDAADSAGVIINMSVWESVEALATFVYSSEHRSVLRRRREWFEPMREAYTALWVNSARHDPDRRRRRRQGPLPAQAWPHAGSFHAQGAFSAARRARRLAVERARRVYVPGLRASCVPA